MSKETKEKQMIDRQSNSIPTYIPRYSLMCSILSSRNFIYFILVYTPHTIINI